MTIIDGYLEGLTGHVCNQVASMNGNLVYVGIDVDDVQYRGSATCSCSRGDPVYKGIGKDLLSSRFSLTKAGEHC